MAYTPTNWQDGDVITTEKLNKIEGELETLDTSVEGILTFAANNNEVTITFHPISSS